MSVQHFLWRVDVGVKFDKGSTTTHTGCIQGRKGWVSFLSFWRTESHNMSMAMWTPTDWTDSFTNSQLSSSSCYDPYDFISPFLFFSWSSMLQRVRSFALWFKQHLCQGGRGNFSMTTRFCSDFVLWTLDRWIFWLLLMLQKKAWTYKAVVQSYVLTFQRRLAVLSNPVDEHDNMDLLL
jgi:hypothetical protein